MYKKTDEVTAKREACECSDLVEQDRTKTVHNRTARHGNHKQYKKQNKQKQNKTRISRFSGFAFAIFKEYEPWAA